MRFRRLLRILSFSVTAAALSTAFSAAQNRYFTFPQLAVGGGWSCDLFVNNQGLAAVAGVEASFFDDDGDPLDVITQFGSISGRALALGPGETAVIRMSSPGPAQAGYAVIRSPIDSSVRATLLVRYTQGGRVATAVGVAQLGPFEHYSFAAEVNSGQGINTGLALANAILGSLRVDQTYVVALIGENGVVRDLATLSLNAGNHVSLFLDDPRLFPGLDGFRGTVAVSSTAPFGLLALRLDQGILSSVAVNYGPVAGAFAADGPPIGEIEPNDLASQSQQLTLPAVVDGVLSGPGDVDFFRFMAASGDVVAIQIEADAQGRPTDSELTLLGPDGSEVAYNDQNGLLRNNDSFILAELAQTGTHSIQVSEFFGDGGSDYGYRLHVLRLRGDGGGGGGGGVPGDLDGVWSGMTGQGFPLSFTISNNRLTRLQVAGRISGAGCSADFDQTTEGSIEITDNPFSFTLPAGPGGVTLQISGSFTSSTAASGNVTMTLNPIPGVPGCSGSVQTTWSAAKGGGGGGGGGQPGSLDGIWAGVTGQGFAIDFTVAGNQITRVHFRGRVEAVGCSAEVEQTTETVRPITNNAFNFSVSAGPGGVSFTFSGTFTSSSAANGNLSITANPIPGVPSCGGNAQTTWSASRQ